MNFYKPNPFPEDEDQQPAETGHSASEEQRPQEEEMITELVERPARTLEPQKEVRLPELPQQLEKDLVQVFKLLSDETRLKILMYLLREGELHVSALCERLGQSQPAVSHHLALLRVAGLIEPRRDGKHNFYSIQRNRFHEIVAELFKSFSAESAAPKVTFDDFVFMQNRNDA